MNNASVKIMLAFFLLAAIPAGAQHRFHDSHLYIDMGVEQGLPANYVDDIITDSYGFLWVATSGGLCRYDGYEFIYFNSSSTPSLRSDFVRNIVEDDFHRLWVASEGGLDVLDLRTFQKAGLSIPISPDPDQPFCWYLEKDATGAVWTKFGRTLYRLSFAADGSIESVNSFDHPGIAAGNFVFRDVERDGRVWASLGGFLHSIGPGGSGALEAVPVAPSLDLGAATYVSDFLYKDLQVWVSTENGLYRLHSKTGEWKLYRHDPADPLTLTQNFVTALAVDSAGSLAAATLRGYNVYNPVSDNFERVGSDVVNCLKYIGPDFFVGTETKGLRIIEDKRLDISHIYHHDSDPGSLAPGAVNAIFQEPDGRLWVGIVEGGLDIREPGQSSFSHLTRERNNLAHNSVSALTTDGKGNIYVGTWGAGVDVVSSRPPHKVVSHLPPLDTRTDYIGALEYDSRNGLLWVCSNRGVFTYDPSTRVYREASADRATGCIGSLIDSRGQLWVGCIEGLFIFNLCEKTPDGLFPYKHYRYKLDDPESMVEEKICDVIQASDSVFFLASNGYGAYRATLRADGEYDFDCYSTVQGLSNDRARGLCKDAKGRIWISTEHGLNLLDPASGAITRFMRQDGLEYVQFYWNNACQGTDGLLYFGHVGGFSVVDPSGLKPLSFNAPLRLTNVEIDGRSSRDPEMSELRVHQRDRSLIFHFALLAPEARSLVRYEYQMAGYDKSWHSLESDRHEAVYSSLPPGSYLFRARAFTREGGIVDELSLPVKVQPFLYNTWWFKMSLIALLAILFWLFIALRTRSILKHQAELEQKVEERTQEISAQKKLVEQKAEELRRQNAVLLHQNEELASVGIIFGPERLSSQAREDDQFLQKAMDVVRRLYKDPDLDVNAFCSAMGMSKTLLNTRLQESVGQSIGQFIRTYRLSLAKLMLQNDHSLNVSEVAYEVGFNDPKYFTRCFTKTYGVTPSSFTKE